MTLHVDLKTASAAPRPTPLDATAGVPAELVTANDFVQVRLALLRYLGGPLEAILFTRIVYRTRHEDRSWIEHDGRRWWTVTLSELATEMGQSEGQVRRALDALVSRSAVNRHQLRENGPYDRRYSYTPVITEVSYSTDRSAENDASQVSYSTDLLLLREGENPPTPHEPTNVHDGSSWGEELCEAVRPRVRHKLNGSGTTCDVCKEHDPSLTPAERRDRIARWGVSELAHEWPVPLGDSEELLRHAERLGDGDLATGLTKLRQIAEETSRFKPDNPKAFLRAKLNDNGARRGQAA